jgi:hypothetical protein
MDLPVTAAGRRRLNIALETACCMRDFSGFHLAIISEGNVDFALHPRVCGSDLLM